MRRIVKKYFIAHKHNNYKPHFYREKTVLITAGVIVVLFLGVFGHSFLLTHTNLGAAILPAVLVDLANESRTDNDLVHLSQNTLLEAAAKAKAEDMLERGYFAHTSPSGRAPWDWITDSGYYFKYAGENLARDFSDSEDVNEAWLDSPTHRKNILYDSFRDIGIVAVPGKLDGKSTIVVVQMFGTPAERIAVPAEIVISPDPTVDELDDRVRGVQSSSEVTSPDNPPEIFVAFENVSAAQASSNTENEEEVQSQSPASSEVERLVANPRKMFDIVFIGLALFLSLGLILLISFELKRQHPKHVAYASLLLGLVLILYVVGREYLVQVIVL